MIKILYLSIFGMQISEKLWDYLKINNNLNRFKNSNEYKFWDFTWTEIILPRSYINIDKDTLLINFWNANIGKTLGLFKN